MPTKRGSAGRVAIGNKIKKLIHEGKTPDQAAGQAYGMARHGDLGPSAKGVAKAKGRGKKHR